MLFFASGPAVAAGDSPPDPVSEWVQSHPKEVAIWSALRLPARLLPFATDCMDRRYTADDSSFPLKLVKGCSQYAEGADRADRAAGGHWDNSTNRLGLGDWEGRPEAIKKWLGSVLGYRAALAEDSREEARTEIAKQKKYSRMGGVVDLEARNEAQQQIREADEELAQLKEIAKANTVKVVPRADKRISQVEACIGKADGDDPDCFRILLLHLDPLLQ
jgi:hypothetical protein